jgi:hypothetical protein
MPQRTKPTRQGRPQKRRDIHILFRKYPIWAAIGTIIFGTFLSWGVPMIPYDLHNGVLIILLGGLISLPFFFQAYQLYTHHNTKKRTWIFIISLVIVGVALIVTQLQVTHPRPKLRIDFDSSSVIASTGELKFRIVNNGQSAAYQYYPIMFAVPANKLEEVMVTSKIPGTNSIEPSESIYLSVNITQPNKVTGIWYLYFKLVYSNAPTGGRLYTDDSPYWLSCDFDNPHNGFVELTPTQRDIFKAAIKACYPSVDIK